MAGRVWSMMRVHSAVSLSSILLFGSLFTFVASQTAEAHCSLKHKPVRRDHGAAMQIRISAPVPKTTAADINYSRSEPKSTEIIMMFNEQPPARISSSKDSGVQPFSLSISASKKPVSILPVVFLNISLVVSEQAPPLIPKFITSNVVSIPAPLTGSSHVASVPTPIKPDSPSTSHLVPVLSSTNNHRIQLLESPSIAENLGSYDAASIPAATNFHSVASPNLPVLPTLENNSSAFQPPLRPRAGRYSHRNFQSARDSVVTNLNASNGVSPGALAIQASTPAPSQAQSFPDEDIPQPAVSPVSAGHKGETPAAGTSFSTHAKSSQFPVRKPASASNGSHLGVSHDRVPGPPIGATSRASVPPASGPKSKLSLLSLPADVIAGVQKGLRAAGQFGAIVGALESPANGAIIRSGMTFFAPHDNSLLAFNLSAISGIKILLQMHAVNQRSFNFSELTSLSLGTRLMTESRLPIVITNNSATNFHVDNAAVIFPDIYSANGVSIHGIDAVLDAFAYNSPPSVISPVPPVMQLPKQPPQTLASGRSPPAPAPSQQVPSTALTPVTGAAPSVKFAASIALPFISAALVLSFTIVW